jgi:hypothetical protein
VVPKLDGIELLLAAIRCTMTSARPLLPTWNPFA